MSLMTPISQEHIDEAFQRIANVSDEARQLALDAIFDNALQEVLLNFDAIKAQRQNST